MGKTLRSFMFESGGREIFTNPPALAQDGHDQHQTRRQRHAAHPRRNFVLLLHLGLDLPHLEQAFVARVARRLDENVESSRNQDRTNDLYCSHMWPLLFSESVSRSRRV